MTFRELVEAIQDAPEIVAAIRDPKIDRRKLKRIGRKAGQGKRTK